MACEFVFKVIIVGEPGVGKSCLLRRFADQSFTENYINTIGVDFKVRTLDIHGKTVKLNIWDSAGQERFRTIVNTYYRGAHGVALVYDTTDRDSFGKVRDWLTDVNELAEPNAKKLLVGTKVDLENRRQVPVETAKAFADSLNIPHIETSSKSGLNVEQAFTDMTALMLADVAGGELAAAASGAIKLGGTSTVKTGKQKKKCCS